MAAVQTRTMMALVLFLAALPATRGVMSIAADASETLQALDTDNSGTVDQNEMLAMAGKEGLDAAASVEIQKEFQELDHDGDGRLDANELSATLSEEPGSMAAPQVAAGVQQGQPATVGAAAATAAQAPLPNAAPAAAGSADATASSDASTVLQQMQSIEGQASDKAKMRTAEIFSAQAAGSLQQKAKDEQGAAALTDLAKKLWSNATTLLSRASTVTATAAREAASGVIRTALTQVKDLEEKSKRAAAAASAKREAAQASMQAAMAAQQGATNLVRQIRAPAQPGSPPTEEQQMEQQLLLQMGR